MKRSGHRKTKQCAFGLNRFSLTSKNFDILNPLLIFIAKNFEEVKAFVPSPLLHLSLVTEIILRSPLLSLPHFNFFWFLINRFNLAYAGFVSIFVHNFFFFAFIFILYLVVYVEVSNQYLTAHKFSTWQQSNLCTK